MIHTLEQLAKLTASSFNGDKNLKIDSVAAISEATSGQISFISNPKYIKQLDTTEASAVILNQELADTYHGNALINSNPYLTFARVLQILYPIGKFSSNIHQSAVIDTKSSIHKNVNIGPKVVIDAEVIIEENVTIDGGCYIAKGTHLAKGVHLYPNVTLYKDTKVGKNTIIHSGAVIGADGFGFAATAEKEWFKILQVGNVVIGDDVEIGANTTIDRAALGTTEISNGVKLDNQIQIGHNVTIGEHTIIASGALIAGSSAIGARCQIAGAVAIAGHISIADDVVITGQTMVIKSIDKSGVYSSGITADENKKWRKNAARFRKLDELAKKVSHLNKKLNES